MVQVALQRRPRSFTATPGDALEGGGCARHGGHADGPNWEAPTSPPRRCDSTVGGRWRSTWNRHRGGAGLRSPNPLRHPDVLSNKPMQRDQAAWPGQPVLRTGHLGDLKIGRRGRPVAGRRARPAFAAATRLRRAAASARRGRVFGVGERKGWPKRPRPPPVGRTRGATDARGTGPPSKPLLCDAPRSGLINMAWVAVDAKFLPLRRDSDGAGPSRCLSSAGARRPPPGDARPPDPAFRA